MALLIICFDTYISFHYHNFKQFYAQLNNILEENHHITLENQIIFTY